MAEYVNKAELMNRIESELMRWGEREYNVLQVLGDIEDFPTADVVEVKRGEWVKYRTDLYGSNHKCSKCGNLADEDNSGHYGILTNYCSNCGAKMDGGGNE